MDVFFFSSTSFTNICAGVGARLWAVRKREGTFLKGIITKSKALHVGSLGIFYCSETHSLTTPFIVLSTPDRQKIVADVWEGEWILPFKIHPFGTPNRQWHIDKAKKNLDIVKKRPGGNISHILHISPQTVFVPNDLSSDDWAILISRLAPPD